VLRGVIQVLKDYVDGLSTMSISIFCFVDEQPTFDVMFSSGKER